MRTTMMATTGSIYLAEVPDPEIVLDEDAIVRITATCVCGSDLHGYRGGLGDAPPKRAGHEFVGVVEQVGVAVRTLAVGDFVVAPFAISDGTCENCRNGVTTSCLCGAFWGGKDASGTDVGGGQADLARVPLADGTLVKVDRSVDDALVPHLLALSDVMGTGHHAAISAGVGQGSTVVVVGDGAVGLCGVLAAHRLGAAQIIVMSRHPARQAVARSFGATDVIDARADEGIAAVLELLHGIGADCVLECVGSQGAMDQAVGSARPGGRIGFVGAPSGGLPTGPLFRRNLHYAGGVAPVRAYLPELLHDVLEGTLRPGAVFDSVLPLAEVAQAYAAMDERRAIKVLLRP